MLVRKTENVRRSVRRAIGAFRSGQVIRHVTTTVIVRLARPQRYGELVGGGIGGKRQTVARAISRAATHLSLSYKWPGWTFALDTNQIHGLIGF